jgi:hypothetical protein
MASGQSSKYQLPFPQPVDAVNVHGDIKSLVERLETVLPQASYVDIPVKNTSGQSLDAGTPLYITGHDGTNVTVSYANGSTTSPVIGLAKATMANNSVGIAVVAGVVSSVNTASFDNGSPLFVASSGGLTDEWNEDAGSAVAMVIYKHATNGIIVVGAKGDGTWGSVKLGLS